MFKKILGRSDEFTWVDEGGRLVAGFVEFDPSCRSDAYGEKRDSVTPERLERFIKVAELVVTDPELYIAD